MAPSRRLDNADLDGYYLRGKAYMQANQLPQAEAEFRALLAHPYIEPSSDGLRLAQLELARVLAREGNISAAIEAYPNFLTAWKNADTGSSLLEAARTELRHLEPAGRS